MSGIFNNDSLTSNEAYEELLKQNPSFDIKMKLSEKISDARQEEIMTKMIENQIKNNSIKNK